MHISTEHRSSKPGRKPPKRASASRPRIRPEPNAAPQKALGSSTQPWVEQHDPTLLLAALEEIGSRQRAMEALLESGLLAHCLQ